ncbi:ammonium transporter [Breoghania corrubedonensis]|uniref:Ammonium transporter n=1 Tax=Breoghania corrubedonensis TaxID=665038 RepID=A0A2T5VIH9_9HYPH|nr:ammonium transporter [Breoghania corrubedonensis]
MPPRETRRHILAAATTLVATLFAFPALADTLDTGDTAWMLTSTALVLLMTIPGLALFYGGMVRKKNVLATAMQSFAAACLMTVLWMVAGYSLAFSDGGAFNNYIGGLSNFMLAGLTKDALSGTIPESVFMTFQMTFAIITPALICGAFADRMKFSALLWFLGIWMLVVYAPVCHWVWGGGFLGGVGVLDFAGGTVVHINSGVAGLVTAIVIGRRTGYGTDNMAPHNMVLSLTGAALLWVGWFGFNAGSAVGANGSAGMAMAVTQISAAAAALAWMFGEWVLHGRPSTLGIVSGAVAGLVGITPASGFVGPTGALAIGILTGLICLWGVEYLKRTFKYDDSLDAFGVHGLGGIVGAILTGVFAVKAIGGTPGGMEGNWGQVWIQIVGIGATIVWSALATFIILKVIDATLGLRVPREVEIEGLDINLHGEVVQ